MRYVLLLLLITGIVFPKAVFVSFDLDRNDHVTFNEVVIIERGAESKFSQGEYAIQLLDKQGRVLSQVNFQPSFMTVYDTEYGGGAKFEDSVYISRTLQYYESGTYIVVKKNDREIARLNLEKMKGSCNENGVCEIDETKFSCPDDCLDYEEEPQQQQCCFPGFIFLLVFLLLLK